ncbi:ionotropic receptor 25a [Leptopilina heterotoma]|uniref:ionotropic receptor 25a n=1 Tax=Leptopilina heterotoma TaxID=63436 RepID=UPI001CA9D3C6|nr:ionotropic receptor 25a [Leptopilina heterotoma]
MRCLRLALIIFGLFLFTGRLVHGQNNSPPVRPTSTKSRPVNLLIINDEENDVANKSVTSALNMLKDKYPDYLGEIYIVLINNSDAESTFNRVCGTWNMTLLGGRSGSKIPDLVLDITKSGMATETVNAITAALGLPTVSGEFGQKGDLRRWRELTDDQKGYLIQVMPPADLVPEIIRQLCLRTINNRALDNKSIDNAMILFNSDFIMDHKYKSLLLNVPTRHVMVDIESDVDKAREQIIRLRDLDIVHFFILGNQETICMAMKIAESQNYTGRFYAWYMITLDEFMPSCEVNNITIMFIKPEFLNKPQLSELTSKGLLPKPLISSAFYYDLTRIAVMGMKAAIDAGEWPAVREQIICEEFNGSNVPKRNLNLLPKLKAVTESKSFTSTYANFVWGEENGDHKTEFNMTVNIVNIYNKIVVSDEPVATWPANIDESLKVINEGLMAGFTPPKSYRVVTVIQKPFVMYDNVSRSWKGYCIDLLDYIRETVPFNYTIEEVADKEYGNMDENGNWNGMIKELKDGKADIALGTLAVMAERENVVDYTVPYYDLVGITILMQKPKLKSSLFKFLTVLETDVWLCILAAYFFTSFLLWIFDRFSPYSYQNNREKYKNSLEKREFTLKECLWFCMTSLTPQGGGEAPKNLSGRLVAATWWLFGFIIIASYTANLAAFLTVSRLEVPIESLEQLASQYKVQYSVIENSGAYTYFERMSNIEDKFYHIWKDMSLNDSLSDLERAKLAVWDYPVSDKYTKMFQSMKEAKFPKSLEEAVNRVRKVNTTNEFALIGDATDIKYLTITNCDLKQVGEEFSRKPYAIAVKQGSPLKDQFNNAILVLLNKRKLEKLKDKWWNRNEEKKVCGRDTDRNDGISIQNIGGVFIVIFVGIALACLTLVIEFYYYRCRPKARKTQNMDVAEEVAAAHVNDASTKIKSLEPNVKPIAFTLRPAPTQALHLQTRYRSRF